MKKPKLLFVVTEDWYFASHRLELAIAASEAGFDVAVAARSGGWRERIEAAGIRFIPFEMSRRGLNPLKEGFVVAKLAKIYLKEKPDIIQHVALKPVVLGGMAALLAGHKKVVAAITGLGFLFIDDNRLPLTVRLIRAVMPLVAGRGLAIVQNGEDAAMLAACGVHTERIRLIKGAGVDLNVYRQHPKAPGEPVVMLASRLLWDKGVAEFADAAAILRARGVNARFVLVGEPDLDNPAAVPEQSLHQWVEDGLIEWWGRRDDMPAVIPQARLFCLPSYREGLPKVLLEAAACARAIVTTDVPGCRDVVRDGDNGLLVPVRDAGALADAIERLLTDSMRCEVMGRRGRALVEEEFSSEIIIEQTLSVYRELLGEADVK